jgi:hypothetical protein
MKFRIIHILTLAILAVGCTRAVNEQSVVGDSINVAESNPEPINAFSDPITIKLGMTENLVASELTELGAIDISSGMQATKGSPKSHWMWTLESPNVSLETVFRDGKLARLNIWDWRTRKMTSYHHTMEHDEIATLTIQPNGEFQSDIIETHNKTKD